jgi:hypothetical protein
MSVGDHEATPRRCPPSVTIPLLVPKPVPWMKRFASIRVGVEDQRPIAVVPERSRVVLTTLIVIVSLSRFSLPPRASR